MVGAMAVGVKRARRVPRGHCTQMGSGGGADLERMLSLVGEQ